jgi:CheY-like chemotaxis protein
MATSSTRPRLSFIPQSAAGVEAAQLVWLGRAWYTGVDQTQAEQIVMAKVLALVDDLFFQAKILETARQVGVEVKTVASGEQLLAEAEANPPKLVLIDLNARQGPFECLERLHAAGNQTPVVAFLSHVQVELAQRARAAGCQQVLPRSQLARDLAAILAHAK